MPDDIYDPKRIQQLVALLRHLGDRIALLQSDADLLAAGPELLKMMGDARSELFHYEVRSTYDTPELAESRRVVEEARAQDLDLDAADDDDSEHEPWRGE